MNGEKNLFHSWMQWNICAWFGKSRAIVSRQLNRLGCSIPRKSTEGRQNSEYAGKINKGHCLCYGPEETDSEDQTCTGTTQSMQTDCQLYPETTQHRQTGRIAVQLIQALTQVYWNQATATMLCHSSKAYWVWELVSDYSKELVISVMFSIRC